MIHTQLRPGDSDYVPWVKIKWPTGSGRYTQKSLSLIDPNNETDPFKIRGLIPSEELSSKIDEASELSRRTLDADNDSGFTTVGERKIQIQPSGTEARET